MLDGNHLPYGVMMKNSEHGRELDDPEGYKEAAYIPIGDKLRKKANGPTIFYIKSKGFKGKENMGRREPSAVGETYLGLRLRRQKTRLMRKKRFSNIAMSMISLAIGQVAGAVGTVVLKSQVSALS